jgi:hypothetical protein
MDLPQFSQLNEELGNLATGFLKLGVLMRKRNATNRRIGAPPPTPGCPPLSPGMYLCRFLPLLFANLLLWRLVLVTPLLDMLRLGVEISFSLLHTRGAISYVSVDHGGDWIVHPSGLFPEREMARRAGLTDPVMRAPRQTLQVLTISLPLFWALALAAWPHKQFLRVFGVGTLLLVSIAQVSVVVLLAYWINQRLLIASSAWGNFCLMVAGNLVVQVVPFAAPVIFVIWLDEELRWMVFGASTPQK